MLLVLVHIQAQAAGMKGNDPRRLLRPEVVHHFISVGCASRVTSIPRHRAQTKAATQKALNAQEEQRVLLVWAAFKCSSGHGEKGTTSGRHCFPRQSHFSNCPARCDRPFRGALSAPSALVSAFCVEPLGSPRGRPTGPMKSMIQSTYSDEPQTATPTAKLQEQRTRAPARVAPATVLRAE